MEKGIFIGKFAPFHIGHAAVIDEIIADGRKPVIIIGSGENYPMSSWDRVRMLQGLYPKTEIYTIHDNPNWDIWIGGIMQIIDNDSVIYVNNKEIDRYESFTVGGKTYTDTFYNDIWADKGIETKQVTYPQLRGITANARDIRTDLEQHKHLLPGKIYRYLVKNNITFKGYVCFVTVIN